MSLRPRPPGPPSPRTPPGGARRGSRPGTSALPHPLTPLAPPVAIDAGPVLLRRWRTGDAGIMADAIDESLDELRRWMPWAAAEPLPLDDRRRLIEESTRQWERSEGFAYGMYADDLMVGCTGLHRRIGPGGIEIGYWVRTSWAGRGVATATTATLTGVALGLPGIDRVEIHHDRANDASRRIPEKLGFTLVAEVPDAPSAPGEEGVECRWRMTREAWSAQRR